MKTNLKKPQTLDEILTKQTKLDAHDFHEISLEMEIALDDDGKTGKIKADFSFRSLSS